MFGPRHLEPHSLPQSSAVAGSASLGGLCRSSALLLLDGAVKSHHHFHLVAASLHAQTECPWNTTPVGVMPPMELRPNPGSSDPPVTEDRELCPCLEPPNPDLVLGLAHALTCRTTIGLERLCPCMRASECSNRPYQGCDRAVAVICIPSAPTNLATAKIHDMVPSRKKRQLLRLPVKVGTGHVRL